MTISIVVACVAFIRPSSRPIVLYSGHPAGRMFVTLFICLCRSVRWHNSRFITSPITYKPHLMPTAGTSFCRNWRAVYIKQTSIFLSKLISLPSFKSLTQGQRKLLRFVSIVFCCILCFYHFWWIKLRVHIASSLISLLSTKLGPNDVTLSSRPTSNEVTTHENSSMQNGRLHCTWV